jgi:mono/diheme cytochrome c family protein
MRGWFSFAVAAMVSACTWAAGLPPAASAIPIVRDRELVVTDDAVLGSMSNNGTEGSLSFRRAMAQLSLSASPDASTLAWMEAWAERLRDDGDPARADALFAAVTCPWLQSNPANGCSESCSTCTLSDLRLEDAPFRLVAVANRTDLSVMPDRAADGGEARLVFALTSGPADSPASTPLPLTVIVEYAQQGAATAWAERWHALGSVTADAFPSALVDLVGPLVTAGTLAQVRTGDKVTGPLLLHEFHLESGALVATTVRNTPDWSRVSASDVDTFAASHADTIAAGTYVLPAAWLASSSSLTNDAPPFVANVPSHDALLQGTCGGCHAQTADGFQIDPLASGDAKLSRFLVDATKAQDEIGRRTQWMQLELLEGSGD